MSRFSTNLAADRKSRPEGASSVFVTRKFPSHSRPSGSNGGKATPDAEVLERDQVDQVDHPRRAEVRHFWSRWDTECPGSLPIWHHLEVGRGRGGRAQLGRHSRHSRVAPRPEMSRSGFDLVEPRTSAKTRPSWVLGVQKHSLLLLPSPTKFVGPATFCVAIWHFCHPPTRARLGPSPAQDWPGRLTPYV
jgi:hypothetical protein